MHPARTTAALAVVLLLGAGCQERLNGFGDTVTYYPSYDVAVNPSGVREGSPRYLRPTIAEVGDTDGLEERLTLAVDLLLAADGFSRCAPGERVRKVEVGDGEVVIRLAGGPSGQRGCTLSGARREVQRQQVAWTVQSNKDPLATDAALTRVTVVGPEGDAWPAEVADWAYLEPSYRPTSSASSR